MPTSGFAKFWEMDPWRWERCQAEAAASMLKEGWNRHAKKFWQVQQRRALKVWRGW